MSPFSCSCLSVILVLHVATAAFAQDKTLPLPKALASQAPPPGATWCLGGVNCCGAQLFKKLHLSLDKIRVKVAYYYHHEPLTRFIQPTTRARRE